MISLLEKIRPSIIERAFYLSRRIGRLGGTEWLVEVCLQEGCSVNAASAADILVTSATDALELLLHEKSMKATLRF